MMGDAIRLTFLMLICLAAGVHSEPTQRIYIAAEEVNWNYAPNGTNVCKGLSFDESGAAALWGSAGLGSTLKKAKFVAYTDDTFSTKVDIPADEVHLGLLGPLIRATPGDEIEVTLKNNINIDLLLEPQGLIPLNPDNAPSPLGPIAVPGKTATYTWQVPPEAAPGPDDADTKLYLYRSVVYPEASDNAGLIGPILVSRQGAPAKPEQGRDIITLMQILDENVSPYINENMGNNTYEDLGLESKAALEESLLKHSINGYVFCNIPALNMTQGEQVRWHSAAMGSEGDMHNSHWHGSTFLLHGHRGDQVKMFPGSALSLDFSPREPGTWLLHCHVNDHIHAGMMALYHVAPAADASQLPENTVSANSTARKYYIAVDEVDWNYAPLGGDSCKTGQPEEWSQYAIPFVEVTSGMAGPRYLKAQFNEYTDETFTTKRARSAEDAYMGILGPVIRAEVGDTVDIVFRNNVKSLNHSVSIHPHGLAYNKSAEGAHYNDGTAGTDRLDDMVPPNSTITFSWQVPETAGPGPNDPPTIGWMYHSHADEVADPLAGLVGMIVVGRPGSMESDEAGRLGTATDVDREVFYLFSVMNERSSFMWPVNLAAIEKRDAAVADAWLSKNVAPAPSGRKLLQEAPVSETSDTNSTSLMAMADVEQVENDLMHGINGYIYCNNPPLQLVRGEKVRFHVMAVGTQVDMHSATLSGSNFNSNGLNGPNVGLMPGSMQTSDVAVVAPAGPAVLQCRVADHIEAGMETLIMIEDGPITTSNSTSKTNSTTSVAINTARAATPSVPTLDVVPTNATRRPYFIQAEESLWDYAPKGGNLCSTQGYQPFDDGENVYMEHIPGKTIGSTYTKALYRRFADSTFNKRFPVPMEHGILGPVIAAEVGDVIEITFKNTLPFAVNLKIDAGLVPMQDSADVNAGVPTGKTVKYILAVPESAGPGVSDLNTVTYGYTSSVDLVYHPYSGLLGIALIGAPGAFAGLNATAMPAEPVPAGVDKMLPLLIGVMNEGETLYFEKNAANAGIELAGATGGGSRRRLFSADASAEAAATGTSSTDINFEESNLMHSINGYMFCNMPEVHVETGKVVRVASLSFGSEADLHSIDFSGQSLMGAPQGSPRGGIEPLMPAGTMSADLKAGQPGEWVFACLIHDHDEAGMKAKLSVDTAEQTAALAAGSSAVGTSSSILSLWVVAFVSVLLTHILV